MDKELTYTAYFEPLEEGGYNVVVPALPEICTHGETLEEARDMAKDAIRCVVESSFQLQEGIPGDTSRSEAPVREELRVVLGAVS